MADWQGNAEPEDLADSSQYCEHGTYVGNWATGDYMCGWCEDGTPWEEYIAIQDRHESQARRKNLLSAFWSNLDVNIGEAPLGYQGITVGILTGMHHSCWNRY